jgi:hypothetical protein
MSEPFTVNCHLGPVIVIAEADVDAAGNPVWLCQCTCGREYETAVHPSIPREPFQYRCPLPLRRRLSRLMVKHGHSRTREYKLWCDLRRRCSEEADRGRYLDRGVYLHAAWDADFLTFLTDVGAAPAANARFERIGNKGAFVPGNVRWSVEGPKTGQRLNSRLITFDGKTATLAEWAKETGLDPATISGRLARKWPLAKALHLPAQKR